MAGTKATKRTPKSIETNTQEIPPEQKEILDAMNELLMSAQELSYTVALVPNDLVEENEELQDLVNAAKNVVRATYKFYKIVKRRGRK